MEWSGPGGPDFERLEFLGDRVLGLIVSDYLYRKYPALSEGEMTRRMAVTSNAYLNTIVPEYRPFIDNYSHGFLLQRREPAADVTSDDFEAWIGFLFLSEGFLRAKEIVLTLISAEIDRFDPDRNYIGTLQEYFQKRGDAPPEYEMIRSDGPAHRPAFTFGVTLPDGRRSAGSGGNKTDAKQEAARRALELIGDNPV
jgi:ribonuclease-3